MKTTTNKSRIFAAMFAAYVTAIAVPGPAHAEEADLSNVPLANSPSDAVLPNLMYILDDSRSMMWDYMPDYAHYTSANVAMKNCKDTSGGTAKESCSNGYQNGAPDGWTSTWGEPPYYSADFNQNYYDPDVFYSAPINYKGDTMGDSVYTAAARDGYTDGTQKNLSSQYSDIYYCGANSATFVGKINDGGTGTTAGKILNVSSVTFGKLRVGDVITTGATGGTTIVSLGTGTGGNGTYNVSTSQSRTTGTTFAIAVTATPSTDVLADASVCRRNGIDNKDATYGYFLYWSTNTTTTKPGGLPYSGFTNRKFMSGNGHYFKVSAHEYCSDVNLQTCELANADGTAPSGFDIPAPLRWCGVEADAASTSKITSASTSTTPKCRKNFDASNFNFPRYGRFTRVNLDQTDYTKSPIAVRPDCASPTKCTLAEEKTNFANWYTWYRTRMAMMKSATGLAFRDINDRYRVGFITINPMSGTTVDTGDKYLKIDKFIESQKQDFYDILYKQIWAGGTPLREALSRVGRHYAGVKTGINAGMTEDPITHSCQQNFALLTTDGYWNDDDSSVPKAQTTTGTAIGNPDNTPTSGTPVYVSRATGTIDGLGTTERIDTPVILTEQARCTGDNNVPYGEISGGDTNKCGCTTPTDARIWERKQTILQKQSYTSGEKVGGMSESPVAGTATFTPVTACTAPRVQKYDQSMTADEYAQCSQNSPTTAFSPNPQVTCSCGTGTPTKKRNYKRVRSFTRTVTLTDGVQTSSVDGTSMYSAAVAQGTGCVSTTLTVPPNTTPAAASLPGTLTSDTGATLTVTFTPTRAPGGDPVTVTTTAKGTANTLADVAMYYYMNDLRTSMPNNVPTNDKDVAPHQHMTTFTLGLGLKGEMEYISNYETASEGDFFRIKSADIGTCSWITDPDQRCDWPKPDAGQATTLDDLWHAAVNGRGLYYSASNPLSLSNGLTNALAALKMQTAAASASATSSPNITETDNFIYSSTFRTVKWDGEVVAQTINASTGAVISTIVWSAQANLDKRITKVTNPGDSDDRLIYTFEPSASDGRKEFFYDQLTSTIGSTTEQSYFDNKCGALSQCGVLSTSQKDIANKGVNLVNYLRGRSEFAITDAPDYAFRSREHVLGDPINATPAFVSKPVFGFADDGYADFKDKWAKRQAVLYIAANDGMLHALNGDNGQELWAYVPRLVFPNLHKLASEQWIVNHEFSVDGSPQTMDVFDATKKEWRTMLVGGLNKGGRGYYALDVTDPTKGPTPMWEFCSSKELCELVDDDLGKTYGNPVITKRASDGKWVVIVTSGLNNVSPGTGKGFLYVLDAITGKVLDKVEAIDGATTWGDTTTPSGLAKISAFANSFNSDNTATFVYGGDLYGNLWRFDMSTSPPEVLKMAQLTDSGGKPQSITSRPELGIIDGNRVVFVGTGRYLGQSDLSDPSTLSPALGWAYQQSLYAIKDKFADSKGPGYGEIRKASPGLVKQTITESSGVRTTSTNPVKWSVDDGWYVDFNPGTGAGLSPGERVNIDPQLILGTLAVVTNVPNKDACSSGGDSFFYQFDYRSGTYISTSANSAVAQKLTGKITVGLVIVRLPKGIFKGILSDNTGGKTPSGLNLGAGGGSGRRVSWREIVK